MSQIIKLLITGLVRCGKSIVRFLKSAFTSLVNGVVWFFQAVFNFIQAVFRAVAYRLAMFLLALATSATQLLAASTGAGGFTKATTEISSYQTPVSNLMKAIAAVIVLVGAFNVYFKMQNGDQDVKKTIMMTIGGCVAFIAMSEALPLFFK
jgi:hypothetical protein